MTHRRFRRLFRFTSRSAQDVRDDVREELRFHLEMKAAALEAEGLDPEAARARALREFGDVDRASNAIRRVDREAEQHRSLLRFAGELRQDVLYGLRLLVRSKSFTVTAIVTLALAIGGNVAIFSVVNALFLQPLPIRDPDTLARIYTGESRVSWPNLEDLAARNAVFSAVIGQRDIPMSMAAEPMPVQMVAGVVTSNYFDVLGVVPIHGRVFAAGEDRRDLVLLSERIWRDRFGRSDTIVGRTVRLDDRPYEVVGVVPRAFHAIAPLGFSPDLWVQADPAGVHAGISADRAATRFEVFGRLKSGVSADAAQASMRVLGAQLAAEHPEVNARFGGTEVFLAGGINVYRGVGKTLLPVFVFIGFAALLAALVLLMSCANLAGLLLGRAAARRQEIAVRLALGAGRARLLRQLLTESLVLATLGAACGLVLASWLARGVAFLVAQLPFPIELSLSPDVRVLAYTVGVAAGCAVLFGVAPGRRASRLQLTDALRLDTAGGGSRQRVRQVLVIAQVAVSALLIFWSGLFARSLLHADTVNPGFDPTDVLIAEVPLSSDLPGGVQRQEALIVEIGQRVAELGGVDSAGWSSIVPLAMTSNERFRVARGDAPAGERGEWVVASRLGPGWFRAVRVPLIAGRDFSWSDGPGSPPVAIVNETLARGFWNGSAVGRTLRYGSQRVEIVGVAGDSKYWSIGETIAPQVYLALRQSLEGMTPTLHVRSADARGTAARLHAEIRSLAPGIVPRIRPMRDAVSVAVMPARVAAIVTGAFGLLGAFLAMIGVYGLISYLVVQRSRELAIRRAIGARTSHIFRVLGGSSLRLTMVGLVLGLATGSLTAPLLGGLLVNVSPRDPVTLLGAAAVMLATAGLACVRPIVHAMRVDPLPALKAE